MNLLVSFGGTPSRWHSNPNIIRHYADEMGRLFDSAKLFGLETRAYDDAWLRAQPFYEEHRDILDLPHLCWLFKPYIISCAMDGLRDGDYLVWADSNMLVKSDPQPIFDICDRLGIFCHGHRSNLPNAHWTRRDVFILMGCDKSEYWIAPQCKASLIAFKASELSRLFISDWLRYCCDIRIIDNDHPNECGSNLPGFKRGRSEQAVLSLVRQKYGISLQPPSAIFVKVDPT